MALIVIRSKTKEKISCTFCYEWSVHSAHRTAGGELVMKSHLVTRERALQIIDKRGLIVAHHTKDGEIYDTPEGDFKALFPRGLRMRDEVYMIEKTDNL